MRGLITIVASAWAVSTAVAAPVDYRKEVAPLAAVDGRSEKIACPGSDTPMSM